ncbi:MAG: energy transducer TonB [Prevotella sp.]|nr:energy transducer TonB [Prevotella sp.]
MKKTMITVLLATMAMGAAAQNADNGFSGNVSQSKNDTTEVKPNNSPEAMAAPQFPGGQEALTKFLKKNVKYPDLAEQYDVEGSVIMHFTVDEDGSIKDISASDCKLDRFNTTRFSQETEVRQKELKKQFAMLFAKEAARVFRKMPKWKPATFNGKTVSTKHSLSIRFINPSK